MMIKKVMASFVVIGVFSMVAADSFPLGKWKKNGGEIDITKINEDGWDYRLAFRAEGCELILNFEKSAFKKKKLKFIQDQGYGDMQLATFVFDKKNNIYADFTEKIFADEGCDYRKYMDFNGVFAPVKN